MTADVLALYAGAVLSLLASYVPGLSGWYDGLEGTYKRLLMAGLLLLVGIGVVGLACAKVGSIPVTCDQAGVEGVVRAFVLALIANQSAYKITKG